MNTLWQVYTFSSFVPLGFRTLGLASTFIAGVEAQFFSVVAVLDSENSTLLQATNGLLLVGILLSASGAVTSLLAARWFEYVPM
jgi:hypothetical protein